MPQNHSPRPWFVFGNGHCVGGPSKPGPHPQTGDPSESAGIAMCGMQRRTPEECAANARLIAAAPDLLAALTAIAERCSIGIDLTDQVTGETFRTLAEEAIAKATGK